MEYLILTVALFLIYFALNELQSAESFFEVASMGAAGNDERGFVVSSQTFLQQMDEFRISIGDMLRVVYGRFDGKSKSGQ